MSFFSSDVPLPHARCPTISIDVPSVSSCRSLWGVIEIGAPNAMHSTGSGSSTQFGVTGELNKRLENIDNNLSQLAGALEQLVQILKPNS